MLSLFFGILLSPMAMLAMIGLSSVAAAGNSPGLRGKTIVE